MGDASNLGVRSLVGRELELAAIEAMLGSSGPRRSASLVGDPGIGKTTLWEAGVQSARERGVRVLAARPGGSEARLHYPTLIDLCQGVDFAAVADVAVPQRVALEVALLRAEPLTGAATRVESDLNAAVAAAATHSSSAAQQAGASIVNDITAARQADATIARKLGLS